MITAGFDIGTRFVKICVVEDRKIIGCSMEGVSRDVDTIIKKQFALACKNAGIRPGRIKQSVATGFGSELVKKAGFSLSEPHCVATAVHSINPEIRTVADIGGLFINLSDIDEKGRLSDNITNDRCAAGSGKFLEMVAQALELPIQRISETARKSDTPYIISSNCAVFAESEVISQVNCGRDSGDIVAGVLKSIAGRTASLVEKMQAKDPIVLCGGVAKIGAFGRMFEEMAGRKIQTVPMDCQMVAAYGAALAAARKKKGLLSRFVG